MPRTRQLSKPIILMQSVHMLFQRSDCGSRRRSFLPRTLRKVSGQNGGKSNGRGGPTGRGDGRGSRLQNFVKNETTAAFTRRARLFFYPVAERRRQPPVGGTRVVGTSWLSFGKLRWRHSPSCPPRAEAGSLTKCAQRSARHFLGARRIACRTGRLQSASRKKAWNWMRRRSRDGGGHGGGVRN